MSTVRFLRQTQIPTAEIRGTGLGLAPCVRPDIETNGTTYNFWAYRYPGTPSANTKKAISDRLENLGCSEVKWSEL